MGVKLERIVKRYYDALEEGKVLGRKCPKCGAIEWPPVYACNACGSTETEWCEMSGKGEIDMLVMPTVMSFKPAYKHLEPYAYSSVITAEGNARNVLVRGVTKKNEAYIRAHMPYPVHMEIVQMDGYKTAIFAIDGFEDSNTAETEANAEAKPSETVTKLIQLVAKTYHMDPAELKPEMAFEVDIKGPSVLFVGLVAQLEDVFDAVLSITEASAAKTIAGLAKLVDERRE